MLLISAVNMLALSVSRLAIWATGKTSRLAMVLALSLWTAPQATMQVAPPHRQLYGEAD